MHAYEFIIAILLATVLLLIVLGGLFLAIRAQSAPETLRPLPGEQRQPCRRCVHFDYAQGQRALSQAEVFSEVIKHVPPHELGRRVVERKTGPGPDDVVVDITPSGPKTADWSAYGACTLHNEGVWGGYHCKDFVPNNMLTRRRRRAVA